MFEIHKHIEDYYGLLVKSGIITFTKKYVYKKQ